MADRPRVLVLLGPTAVGKTAVAAPLCRLVSGEVIAADSRQVYRGLAIGSAAPTAAELAETPHHLVGWVDPRDEFTVAEFVPAAEALVGELRARGRHPVLVVGTGMWLRALLEGWTLAQVPADPALREALGELDSETLWSRLAGVDPDTAARLAPADRKRIVRAIEVCEATGEPLSRRHREQGRRPVPFDYRLHGLRRPREVLYNRINRRVDAMLAAGWLDEVRALLASGLTGTERCFEGLGYRHLVAHLRGEVALAEAVAATQQETRRFAKRQMTWFRAMPDVLWHDLPDDEPADETAARIGEGWT